MQKELFTDNFYFLNNNLFSTHTLTKEFPQQYDFTQDLTPLFDNLKSIYDKESFKKKNEHQFEDDFISKALSILEWDTIRQEIKIIQGKQDKPDFTLFTSSNNKKQYESLSQEKRYYTNEFISVLCESKAYDIEVDNKKIKDNPHFQIVNYLNSLKIKYGFLTNGRKWRFYDSDKFSSQKVFYEIDLEAIIEKDDIDAFRYFYFVFRKANFEIIGNESSAAKITQKDDAAKISIEENLKSVIYGYNNQASIFQTVGKSIFLANRNANVDEIYENSVYFIFRILFIAYFEDKYEDILKSHTHYGDFSLESIYDFLEKNDESHYTGYRKLKELFNILDNGDEDIDIPLFNGGLFDLNKAPLLNTPKLINNKTLKFILDALFYFQENGKSLFKRDFKTLSIAHIGKIYEGILSFRFEVIEEDTYYIEYTDKKSKNNLKLIDGFFDAYDYEQIAKNNRIVKEEFYAKGELALKNSSNSRKTTASYYTPQSLSQFLVKESIEQAVDGGKNLLDLRILDNSCGSGHFLVEALDFIAAKALALYETDKNLKEILATEKSKIEQSISKYIKNTEVDELDVLKRILLKKLIFGIDLNPFAVELTRLSLWMDSFIFGTPLSFIEHHVKCGNALVGSTIKAFMDKFGDKGDGNTLFTNDFKKEFEELAKVYEKLDNLKDATTAEIEESKSVYKKDITPKLQKLNTALNIITMLEFKKFDKTNTALFANLKSEANLAEQVFESQNQTLINEINEYADKYSFFNYEIEFPEVFCHKDKLFSNINGFGIIIGNPPWDKTKFSDNDFFPQFVSNYRTLIDSKKKEVRENILSKKHIKEKYDDEQDRAQKINNYYKTNYPLNKGSGDGNLFRFFTEKNLSILNVNGTLNYVLPSALMFEEGSGTLRREIFEKFNLNIFYSFENKGIFEDIDDRYKFAVMQIENCEPNAKPIKTMFYKTDTKSLSNPDEIVSYELDTLRLLSPEHLSMMEVRSTTDLEILKKCYAKYQPLDENWLDFRRELDMTNDKEIFIEERKDGLLPLYEGKMIWQYNSDFDKPNYYLDKSIFDAHIIDTEARRIVSDIYPQLQTDATPQIRAVLEYFGLPYSDKDNDKNLKQLHRFVRFDREFVRLGFRAIARDTDERTLIFSMLPEDCGFGHSMFADCPKNYVIQNDNIGTKEISSTKLLFAQSIFNSIVVDFIARQMVQINVSKTYLNRLPIPQPSDDEIMSNRKDLLINSLKLTLYHDFESFAELAKEFSITKADLPKTDKQVDMLKIENDCIVAKMYGISKDELEYILGSFKVLKDKKPEYVKMLLGLYK